MPTTQEHENVILTSPHAPSSGFKWPAVKDVCGVALRNIPQKVSLPEFDSYLQK
jgi:hypothetical protein